MADLKITQLTALATPVGEDLLPIVDDPSGSPVTKKVTVTNLASAISPTITSIIPRPVQSTTGSSTETTFGTNTIQSVYMFNLPAGITVNKISLRTATTVTTSGTWDIVIYSEDGQTQKISVTTASVSTGDTIITTSVSSVYLAPGNYYFAINPNSTAQTEWCVWILGGGNVFGTTAGLNGDISSEPVLAGRITITASTPATNFNPTSDIVENSLAVVAPIFRLDT